MNVFLTKDRRMNANRLLKADQRFHEPIEAAAADEPIVISPVDKSDHHLLRVLIVDDHRATAKTLSSLVRIWGHDVRCAYDGVTGLALAAAFRPDVLLLDMLMSDVNGFEVARQVRRQNRLKDCFIVAVTGRTDAKHRCQCYEAGVDLFLIKPVAPPDMQTLLGLESELVRQINSSVRVRTVRREFAATY
jgi:CheY-like chemotaxis protein